MSFLARVRPLHALILCVIALASPPAIGQAPESAEADALYYPPKGTWETVKPAEAGFDAEKLETAIVFAREHETRLDPPLSDFADARNLPLTLTFSTEPHNTLIGPVKPRGAMTGVIVRGGRIVAQWGDPARVDMTFSITKSFLSATVGLAFDRGLIEDVNGRVGADVPIEEFATEHNGRITWDHMLRQTSSWQGTLWDKPDWADRPGDTPWAEFAREPAAPGTRWKYNDVRVNALALAALHMWRRPLPEALKEHLMDPIGASDEWQWHGYENSWVNIDGTLMQSVSGGGHWGGGVFISGIDLARFGLLALRGGKWRDKQILSEVWMTLSRTPTDIKPTYGHMNWFLNTGQELLPAAPASAFYFAGGGSNIVYVDEENDLVAVIRWIDREHLAEFIALLLDALN